MLKEIIIAIQSFGQAHKFVQQHKLWKWIWIPGIVYTILFLCGVVLFWYTSSALSTWILTDTGIKAWLESLGSDWFLMAFMLAQVVIWITLLFFYFSIFKYVFLIVGSPLFAYLSEKTESILENKNYEFNWIDLVKDIARAFKIALRNLLWQSVYMIFILILSFIPIVGWITPALSFILECYYFGFSMLDYSCERNRLTAFESIRFIGHHKGLAIGNGLCFFGLHLIPIIGWVIAPTYAVIAATMSINTVKNDLRLKKNSVQPQL